MLLLMLWCGVGAAIGLAIGISRGRPGVGVFLGTFCGVFGWLMLLAADPVEREARSFRHPNTNATAGEESATEEPRADAPSPIRWVAQTTEA